MHYRTDNHFVFLLGQLTFLQLCCHLLLGFIFEFYLFDSVLELLLLADDFEDATDFTDFRLAFDLELTADTSLKTDALSSSSYEPYSSSSSPSSSSVSYCSSSIILTTKSMIIYTLIGCIEWNRKTFWWLGFKDDTWDTSWQQHRILHTFVPSLTRKTI